MYIKVFLTGLSVFIFILIKFTMFHFWLFNLKINIYYLFFLLFVLKV